MACPALRADPGLALVIGNSDYDLNYLLVRDSDPTNAESLFATTATLQSILLSVSTLPSKATFVVLDACRTNGFTAGLAEPGLASVDAPRNAFIAFSTAPGMIASDG